jgi:hypothetical protein
MMKKLLILLLVLGMTSAANALVVNLSTDGSTAAPAAITVGPGDVLNMSVISDTAGIGGIYWTYLEMGLPSAGAVSVVAFTANAGNAASVTDYSSGALTDWELSAADTTPGAAGIVAGQQFTFTLTIDAAAATDGSDDFDIWTTVPLDNSFPVDDLLTVNIVPEPMTIALLGLGGLFLLRRRK